MTVDIKCTEVSCNGNLFQYVIEKLLKLEAQYDCLKGSTVSFKSVENPEGQQKICEIELPGQGIFASAKGTDLKLAAKETLKILNGHLRKHEPS